MGYDPRKQSLYFKGEMLAEIEAEARRYDIAFSKVVRDAWMYAKAAAAAGIRVPGTVLFSSGIPPVDDSANCTACAWWQSAGVWARDDRQRLRRCTTMVCCHSGPTRQDDGSCQNWKEKK